MVSSFPGKIDGQRTSYVSHDGTNAFVLKSFDYTLA